MIIGFFVGALLAFAKELFSIVVRLVAWAVLLGVAALLLVS